MATVTTGTLKTCARCEKALNPTLSFLSTNNRIYGTHLPICNACIEKLVALDPSWGAINKICQWLDIPFIPKEFDKFFKREGPRGFISYAKIFATREYETLDWIKYNEAFLELEKRKLLERELPGFEEERTGALRKKWGSNYDSEELDRLEELYNGLLSTQPKMVNPTYRDQAQKLCKVSLNLDSRIREGADISKILGDYNKLLAIFEGSTGRSRSDFDSTGEIFTFLEKIGWKNEYYDGSEKDLIDKMMKDIEEYNARLYTTETGIGEEIERRISLLLRAKGKFNDIDEVEQSVLTSDDLSTDTEEFLQDEDLEENEED